MIFTTLLYNAALLLALGFLYSLIARHWERERRTGQVYKGLLFGLVALAVMANPVHLMPGVVFDTRSVVLSIAGMFGGPISALIAVAMACIYRIWMGGLGAFTGVLVACVSGAFGVAYYFWAKTSQRAMRPHYLYLFGLTVHVAMLICMFSLPLAVALRALENISASVLSIYPVVTLLLALMLKEGEASIAATRALAASESRFRSSFDNANIGMSMIGTDGRLLRVNSEFCRMLGYAGDELVGIPFNEITHPEDHAIGNEILDKTIKGEMRTSRFEKRYLHKDGSTVWARVSASLVRDANGAPLHFITQVQDITESRRVEQALRESEARYRRIVETADEGIWIVDRQHNTTFVNSRMAAMLGYAAEEMLGRPAHHFMAEDQLNDHMAKLAERRMGKPGHYERRLVRKDGSEVWSLVSVQAILDQQGQFDGAFGMFTDITERKRAEEDRARLEEQLQQMRKLESIGRLAGGVAHDMNNLLSPILGYGEMLLEDTSRENPNREPLEEIVKAGERARQLVHQLLAFGRKQTLEFKSVDLNSLLGNFENLLRRTIREDIAIHLALASSLPLIMGDPVQLEQVVMNLAVNAQDAMPDGGELTIETALADLDESYVAHHQGVTPGTYVMLMVSDTGIGMDAEQIEYIFEPFFTTKGGDKGTGLGLATVYGIVKQHRGDIWAYSEPGLGATFKVYLPVTAEAGHAMQRPPRESSARKGSETVLLVEDNRQVRDMALTILQRQGYTVLAAASGKEALVMMASHDGPVHLLLTDVVMPEMNGRKLFEEASRLQPDLKALYMSGYTDNVIAHCGVMDPEVQFIQKPFAISALTAKVREVLDR